ncbi:hypothetical protein [Onishia taeanensis]
MPRYIVKEGEFDASAPGHGPDWWVVDTFIAHRGEGPSMVARFETEAEAEVEALRLNARDDD